MRMTPAQIGDVYPAAKRQQAAMDRYPGASTLVAAACIALAMGVRLTLVSLGWPHLNSDEGTMGLMALNIAHHGQYPIFFYGQAYMGALEAYLAAPLFVLFGPSDVALRAGLVVMFGLFLAVLYLLASRLYGRSIALLSLLLLGLGSERMLFRELQAIGGYVETLLFAALLFLLTYYSVRIPAADSTSARQRSVHTTSLHMSWGLVAGLGIWTDMLIVPWIAASGALLFLFRPGDLAFRRALPVLGGLLLGTSPVLLFVTHTAGTSLVTVLLAGFRAGSAGHVSLLRGLAGTFLVSLPIATGGNAVCALTPNQAWPLSGGSGHHVVLCTAIHGTWGLAFSGLGLVGALGALRMLRHGVPTWYSAYSSPYTVPTIVAATNLAAMSAAGCTLFLYACSASAANSPWFSARYLTPLWLAFPGVLAAAGYLMKRFGRWSHTVSRLSIVAAAGVFLLGTVQAFEEVPGTQWLNWRQHHLIGSLMQRGMTRLYSDYWTCDRLAFQSEGQLACAVLQDDWSPGLNRYLPFRRIVDSSLRPTYAFPLGSPEATQLIHRLNPPQRRGLLSLDGYVVYSGPRAPVSSSSSAGIQAKWAQRSGLTFEQYPDERYTLYVRGETSRKRQS